LAYPPLPVTAELRLVAPPGFASVEAFCAALVERLAAHEKAARVEVAHRAAGSWV
jgi:hypothetical protein